jgi:hypothetical protein
MDFVPASVDGIGEHQRADEVCHRRAFREKENALTSHADFEFDHRRVSPKAVLGPKQAATHL